jgi:vacuolar-type H+-ATPase subunit E/Vma4
MKPAVGPEPEPVEQRPVARASAVESLIEMFAERLNKIGSQADADRLQAEIEHAAKTLAPEELLAYAAAPSLRGRLLSLCVLARAQERAAAPRGSSMCEELEGEPGPLVSTGARA